MINILRDLRTAKGWTQADLGERLGVSRQAIIAIEADKHDPSLDLAYKIAALFETGIETIFPNPHVG
jgi:putative transcriptional regulator